jgi:hypothetical protein
VPLAEASERPRTPTWHRLDVFDARFGVPEVWIVDIVGAAIEADREPQDRARAG